MRLAPRTDSNHRAIVEALRSAGCRVQSLAAVGKGVPDLLVFAVGRLSLLEIKGPRGKLTPDQQAFRRAWPVAVVRTPAEALAAVGLRVVAPEQPDEIVYSSQPVAGAR